MNSRSVLITGAGRGIGRAIARRLVGSGDVGGAPRALSGPSALNPANRNRRRS